MPNYIEVLLLPRPWSSLLWEVVMTQTLLQIVNGPGKFDLMYGLFAPSDQPYQVTITVMKDSFPQTIKVFVARVEREDGSGESWNLLLDTSEKTVLGDPGRFEAYYHSVRRKGNLTLG